ncbi:hypothetical protein M3Y97_00913500 [Aphelenchoides bicaudatus]|nr:hypothetical protein M3Y97_00913500 [Aphelenchoides bicaudatus]
MIIENIPNELATTKNKWDVFEFSPDSRFIYKLCADDRFPTIFMYDSMFNNCITLRPDQSITNLRSNSKGFTFTNEYSSTIYIDTDKLLIILKQGPFQCVSSTLIVLVKLDFQQKCYRLLDKAIFKRCIFSTLVRDGDQIGLLHVKLGRADQQIDQSLGLIPLTIKNNKIKSKERIEFDYDMLLIKPCDPHLFDNKLWYYRDETFAMAMDAQSQIIRRNPTRRNLFYFDLSTKRPKEIKFMVINTIKVQQHQWVGGLLLCAKSDHEFACINLKTAEWSTLNSSVPISNYYSEEVDWLRIKRSPSIFSNSTFMVYCDQQLNLTAINIKDGNLHRISLKQQPTLTELAWNRIVNLNLLNDGRLSQYQKLTDSKLF